VVKNPQLSQQKDNPSIVKETPPPVTNKNDKDLIKDSPTNSPGSIADEILRTINKAESYLKPTPDRRKDQEGISTPEIYGLYAVETITNLSTPVKGILAVGGLVLVVGVLKRK